MQKLALSLLALPLLIAGCAHQSYPELPPDIAAQHVGGAMPVDSAAQVVDPSETALAADVSDVAEREARLAPVPQEVVPPPPDPATLPAAEARRLEILLGDRRFEYFEDEQLVWSGKISAGAPEHPTPAGEFRVTAKDVNKRSGSYTNYFNWPTPMPYALQFSGPYWVHEGYVPNEHASHGCVRLRHDDARFVYARMKVGDSVKVVR
jgi:lipoprotein-anchoring transpeptidase ErfK/SrfK